MNTVSETNSTREQAPNNTNKGESSNDRHQPDNYGKYQSNNAKLSNKIYQTPENAKQEKISKYFKTQTSIPTENKETEKKHDEKCNSKTNTINRDGTKSLKNKEEENKDKTLKGNPNPKKGKQTIKISQINLNHAKVSSSTLMKNLNNEWTPEIKHIVLIQEPYKNYKTGRIKNASKHYKTYASQKTKFPRAIIQISKPYNTSTMFHEEFSDRDNCTISITDPNNPKKRVYISSNYLPETEDIEESLLNTINEKQDKNKNGLISCADTNAHSTVWGNNKNNKRGDKMELAISKYNLKIENTDLSSTYHKGENHTTIDLTLTNNYAPKIQNWILQKGKSHSDHELIEFEIKTKEDLSKKKPRYNNRTIHYKDIFKQNLEKEIKKMGQPLDNISQKMKKSSITQKIDQQAESITNAILKALKDTPNQKIKIKSNKRKKDWPKKMTELSRKITKLHLLKNYPQKTKSKKKKSIDYNNIKNKLNKTKKILKNEIEEKEKYEKRNFYSSIEKTKPLARLCKVLELQNHELGSLTYTDGTFTKDKTDTLNYLADELIGKKEEVQKKTKIQGKPYTGTNNKKQVEEIVNEKRLGIAIKELKKKKATGNDELTNELIIESYQVIKNQLIKLMKASIQYGHTPKIWQQNKSKILPKPGKDNYSMPKSYRIITLSSNNKLAKNPRKTHIMASPR